MKTNQDRDPLERRKGGDRRAERLDAARPERRRAPREAASTRKRPSGAGSWLDKPPDWI